MARYSSQGHSWSTTREPRPRRKIARTSYIRTVRLPGGNKGAIYEWHIIADGVPSHHVPLCGENISSVRGIVYSGDPDSRGYFCDKCQAMYEEGAR